VKQYEQGFKYPAENHPVTQYEQGFKYPAENHPVTQYEQGFKYPHTEGLRLSTLSEFCDSLSSAHTCMWPCIFTDEQHF